MYVCVYTYIHEIFCQGIAECSCLVCGPFRTNSYTHMYKYICVRLFTCILKTFCQGIATFSSLFLFLWPFPHAHTHTHKHIQIYMCIQIYIRNLLPGNSNILIALSVALCTVKTVLKIWLLFPGNHTNGGFVTSNAEKDIHKYVRVPHVC